MDLDLHDGWSLLGVTERVEARLSGLTAQAEVAVAPWEVPVLIGEGGYSQSFGLGSGAHYRKAVGNGCHHLRVDGGRATLHFDAWDPRRFPLRHFFEVPTLWVPPLAIGLVLGVAAASSAGATRPARVRGRA